MTLASFPFSIAYFLGLLLLFAGERIVGVGSARAVLSVAGAVVVLSATALRAWRRANAAGNRRQVEQDLLVLKVVGVVALLLYFLQSDGAALLGIKLQDSAPKLASTLAALWPILLAAAVLPLALAELSYASMARSPEVEVGRVRDAVLSGLGTTGALVFAFCLVYVATARDTKWDFSYFRTARPGESTRRIVQALEEPIEVALFFPPANEVREQARSYFEDLKKESAQLKVAEHDFALEPTKARELGVTANGTVVIFRGTRKEPLFLGVELERARFELQNLDREVQERLLKLARARRTLYFTSGHGERARSAAPGDQRLTIGELQTRLGTLNQDIKTLSAAEGLASDVPSDASAVWIIGPTKPFLPEEVAALQRYFDRGGRVFMALDPDAGTSFAELLTPFGLTYKPVTLANDVAHFSKTGQVSDRAIIGTASYSSHPAVTTLGRVGGQAPMALMVAGHLEQRADSAGGMTVDFPVRAHPQTWNDENGNFQLDPPAESRRSFSLAAVVTRKKAGSDKPEEEGRAVVLADSDALADTILGVPGNELFAGDTALWLLGEERFSGRVSSEVDVPVQHTRKQDIAWFYITVFAVPALVVALGYVLTRRRGRRMARPAEPIATEAKAS